MQAFACKILHIWCVYHCCFHMTSSAYMLKKQNTTAQMYKICVGKYDFGVVDKSVA